MKSILEALYDGFMPSQMSERERQILQEADPVLSLAREKLTVQEWNTLWDAAWQGGRAEYEDVFAQGFRLGVQLTLAGLEPVQR